MKEHQIKKKNLQSSDQIPRSLVFTQRGEEKTKQKTPALHITLPPLRLSFPLSVSPTSEFIYPGRLAKALIQSRPGPGVMEGKMPLFRVPVSLEVRKALPRSLSLLQLRLCFGPVASPNGRLVKNSKKQNRRGGESK